MEPIKGTNVGEIDIRILEHYQNLINLGGGAYPITSMRTSSKAILKELNSIEMIRLPSGKTVKVDFSGEITFLNAFPTTLEKLISETQTNKEISNEESFEIWKENCEKYNLENVKGFVYMSGPNIHFETGMGTSTQKISDERLIPRITTALKNLKFVGYNSHLGITEIIGSNSDSNIAYAFESENKLVVTHLNSSIERIESEKKPFWKSLFSRD